MDKGPLPALHPLDTTPAKARKRKKLRTTARPGISYRASRRNQLREKNLLGRMRPPTNYVDTQDASMKALVKEAFLLKFGFMDQHGVRHMVPKAAIRTGRGRTNAFNVHRKMAKLAAAHEMRRRGAPPQFTGPRFAGVFGFGLPKKQSAFGVGR